MPYTLGEIAALYKASEKTVSRRIKALKEQGKFEKKSTGKFYDTKEVAKLAELLDFPFTTGKAA